MYRFGSRDVKEKDRVRKTWEGEFVEDGLQRLKLQREDALNY